MMDLETLEQFGLEVGYSNAGRAWFTFWHENCGTFLIEDYAERMGTDLKELAALGEAHLLACDK
jgi:hypothetical protein